MSIRAVTSVGSFLHRAATKKEAGHASYPCLGVRTRARRRRRLHAPCRSEEQRTLAPQARVRITLANTFVRPKGFPRTFEGHVVQLDDRTLTVRPHWSPAVVVIPREAIARLDVQTRPSKRGVGALAGVGLAGLAGLAIGHGADEPPS